MAKKRKKPAVITRVGFIVGVKPHVRPDGVETRMSVVRVRTAPGREFENTLLPDQINTLVPAGSTVSGLVGKPCYYNFSHGKSRWITSMATV